MAQHVLQDFLANDLRIVFCGTSVGRASAARGHYYAGPGNEFWAYLCDSGLVPVHLRPEDDSRVLSFGIGLTDLAKTVVASSDKQLRGKYDVSSLITKIERFQPKWIAFHGKEAAGAVANYLGLGRAVSLGRQDWLLAESRVFVVPSASGANRDKRRLEGKLDRLDWFRELRTSAEETS